MTQTTSRTAQLTRSTLIVMIAFAAAKAISFLQTFIIARELGISADYDAFVAANRLPEVIFNLIAGGAIAFAFIPVFTGLLAKDNTEAAWRVASTVLNTIFGVTAVVSITAFVLAPWLVQTAIAPGFPPELQAQTADMMRILLLSTLIFSVSGMMMGILQSFNRFLLPALAPILFDIGVLIGVLFLLPALGVYGLAWGAVLGAAMHLAIQVPGLLRVGIRWTPRLDWRSPDFRRIVVLFIPRMLDLALASVSAIVVTNLLSRLGEGATSAYDWGWRLMQIPETLIGTAMGIVIFPTLAALSALGDVSGKRQAFSGSLRFILIATIPSAILLIAAGMPLLSLLEGGAFDASATQLVYTALVFFSFGIVVHSMLEVIARSFYADKDTFVPLLVAVGGAAVNIVVALVFSGVLTGDVRPENVGALALANTLGVLFEVIVLGIVLRRRWNGLDEGHIGVVAGKTLVASVMMGIAAVVVNEVLSGVGLTGGLIVTALRVAVILAASLGIFVGLAYVLRIEEVKIFIAQSVRKIRQTVSRSQAQAPA
jgi:putative peptidoglycan lipid II flippase